MKLKNQDKNSQDVKLNGSKYWRSLDDLSEAPAFKDWLHREFPQGASEIEGVNRRHFMKIMAASFGLAGLGLSGCRRPEQIIRPYAKQPEMTIPGVASYFSTSMPAGSENQPLIVETHENRPTKIEGNPSYIPYGGGTSGYAQASVLDLYDPDRAKHSTRAGKKISKAVAHDILHDLHTKLSQSSGKGVAFLSEMSSSPTRHRLIQKLRSEYPDVIWSEYEPIISKNPEIAANQLFGKSLKPSYKFEKAHRVVSFDCDFLQSESGSLSSARGFSKARKVISAKDSHKMNRLYSVEAKLSATGGMADHRLRLSSSHILPFLRLFAAELFNESNVYPNVVNKLKNIGGKLDVDHQWIHECVTDLISNKQQSLVVVGSHYPVEAHILAFAINEVLESVGHTVDYLEIPSHEVTSIKNLTDSLNSGDVETLVVLGGNPVYNAPGDLDWKSAQSKASHVIRWGYEYDDTSKLSGDFIAATHYLESWSDGRTLDGTYLPVQPMIQPLFEGLSAVEVMSGILGMSDTDSYSEVRKTFDLLVKSNNPDLAFNKFLAEGLVEDSKFKTLYPSIEINQLTRLVSAFSSITPRVSSENVEVLLPASLQIGDGRYANNGWLMECPEPMTKLTWDNAILISPRLAKELEDKFQVNIFGPEIKMNNLDDALLDGAGKFGLEQYEAVFDRGKEMAPLAILSVNGRSIKGPLHVQPGLANYTLVAPLGFGRKTVGRIGEDAGFDAYPLVNSENPLFTNNVNIEVLSDRYKLANTQEHWSMEGRAIIRESSVEAYKEDPNFVDKMGMESHSPPIYGADKDKSLQEKSVETHRGMSAYEFPNFDGAHQWGMAVDLNTCSGCNACVIACQSENNIPIVGKFEVARGREMHWMRLDRYYSSDEGSSTVNGVPEDVQVSFQGISCAQCETAPCEQVCPVNATVHDDEGLNTMAYNRCVGTRYCANNCPYKVRRFNFYDWNKRAIDNYNQGPFGENLEGELPAMQRNPDVTVRMRGVMEKCTYCVQRLQEAKIHHKNRHGSTGNVKVPDGTIKVACQQVCSADAISFGDISDPESEVSKMKLSDRDYSLLGYLQLRPRTTYLAKIRNPNPKMPNSYSQPFARQEYEDRYGHGDHHGHEDSHGHDAHGPSDHGHEKSNHH